MSSLLPPEQPLPTSLGGTATDYLLISPPEHTSSSLKNLSPSILIITLILVVTIIASVSLCFILRQINRRCLSHLSSAAAAAASSTASSRRISPEVQQNVRDSTNTFSLIDSLPLFIFSSISRRSSGTTTPHADCAVCLSKFEPCDELRLLPLCCHAFHVHCIDTWFHSNQTCPLCRSAIFVSESEVAKALLASSGTEGRTGESFRIEIGNVSSRRTVSDHSGNEARRSYSIGSFEYIVDDESEVSFSYTQGRTGEEKENNGANSVQSVPPEANLAGEVANGRSWLMEQVDRLSSSLSSRAISFRSSGRFFTGSSRRTEVVNAGDWDVEANHVGDEIVELFRWFSGV